MTPVLRLFIIVWIKVYIMQYNYIGRGKINAQTTGFGGEEENKYSLVIVVLVYQSLSEMIIEK